ncbi:MAG: flavodoxin domain-containing protein [Anaerolineae bacterium]|nr:flavodoxin domain-containing protein [Anaerolineae bacterium]
MMSSTSVLIAYASSHGSTQEVAEAIAETLHADGITVTVEHMRKIKSLKGYGAVVLGAPLYMFHWHKDARHFLTNHREALVKQPVAVFALGPVGAGDEKEWQEARANLEKELSDFPWFVPVTVELFGGKLDPAGLGFPMKYMMGKLPPADLRDWDAIRAWATSLPAKFWQEFVKEH